MKHDSLGNRMKRYEIVSQQVLSKRTYTIIRVDGKRFSQYTKGLIKPFDDKLMSDMDEVAKYLCQNIQNAKLAFVQSDEISVVIADFDELETESWFDNNVQKMVSVSASMATAKFIMLRPNKIATFDSRVWQIPTN
jgi:tRNA(His) 5'-end guanylyltransferase